VFRTNFTYASGEAGGGDGNAVQHSGRRQEKKSANHRELEGESPGPLSPGARPPGYGTYGTLWEATREIKAPPSY